MNWTQCTWIEAANAFAAGTHEAEIQTLEGQWLVVNCFWCDGKNKYRIREKPRTITVTIPRPNSVGPLSEERSALWASFNDGANCAAAIVAMQAAMEQQP
jgi:hypothetical protein